MPTIARMVKVYCADTGRSLTPNKPPKLVMRIPDKATNAARAISTINLYFADRSLISSVIPIAKRIAMARKQVNISGLSEKGNQKQSEIAVPVMIAIPPSVGVGIECSLRIPGTSCSLYLLTSNITGGILTMATTNDVMKQINANL